MASTFSAPASSWASTFSATFPGLPRRGRALGRHLPNIASASWKTWKLTPAAGGVGGVSGTSEGPSSTMRKVHEPSARETTRAVTRRPKSAGGSSLSTPSTRDGRKRREVYVSSVPLSDSVTAKWGKTDSLKSRSRKWCSSLTLSRNSWSERPMDFSMKIQPCLATKRTKKLPKASSPSSAVTPSTSTSAPTAARLVASSCCLNSRTPSSSPRPSRPRTWRQAPSPKPSTANALRMTWMSPCIGPSGGSRA
mmetsp:Transcript_10785/g.28843  ORF Transcript_10785/g.28843 Transcript_10785/m.28843 type:complete len:251 (+) Transcript_10785:347-1099(+)